MPQLFLQIHKEGYVTEYRFDQSDLEVEIVDNFLIVETVDPKVFTFKVELSEPREEKLEELG